MRILVDMNLSPQWGAVLHDAGHEAIHWSAVGAPAATDKAIMAWARQQGYMVLTHDLDFGTVLALTRAQGPSVLQIRTQDVFPSHLATALLAALRQFRSELEAGAIVVVDEKRARVRMLPILH